MIQSTPTFVVAYKAINKTGEREQAVVLSPLADVTETLEKDGFRKVSVLSSQVLK